MFHSLPALWLIGILIVAALATLSTKRLRLPAILLLALCWSLVNFHLRLANRLDAALAGQFLEVNGVISSIPAARAGSVRFQFRPDAVGRGDGLPSTLLVYWYRDWPQLSVGEFWRLELKIRPPWGRVNFQGTDKERWLFARNIGAVGTVRSGQRLAAAGLPRFPLQSVREGVLLEISARVAPERGRGVVQALATADRSGLADADRQLLRVTGTSHLMAISGLHVGLAAAGGMWLSRVLLLFLPFWKSGVARLRLSIAGGLLSAGAYAALAGLGTPTLRSVLMLFCVMTALMLCRSIHPFRAWLLGLAAILVIDPFAPLGAGLWFSFLAVAALLFVFLPRTGRLNGWKTALMAQSGVVLVLLPVSAAWFQSFSPAGFMANLLAIPWVSFLVVPPVLAGLAVLPISGALAGVLWSAAGLASTGLFYFLGVIERFQGGLTVLPSPSLPQTILAFLGALVVLLPRGIPTRWLGLFLILPLFLPPGARTHAGSLEVEVLDVGQGTAVLVSSGKRSLLYDSGPGDGKQYDLVESVITPAVARLGPRAPQQVIISHGDLDHAGGLASLRRLYPAADYRANLAGQGDHEPGCQFPQRWSWPGVVFQVLHPSPGLPYLGNDSSCVVSVNSSANGLFLSGDISEVVEYRLLNGGLPIHPIVLVPHHGSRTSSSPSFIKQLQPEVAIATAGLGNRFDFPRPDVRRRYEAANALFWSTGDCGALRLLLYPDGRREATSARRKRNRVWRWPAARNCP